MATEIIAHVRFLTLEPVLSSSDPSKQDTYEILDGVRRAKAYFLSKKQFIPVQVYVNGIPGPVIHVAVSSLYSPKKVIETHGAGFARWRKVLRAVEASVLTGEDVVPPLEVERGSRGTHIVDVLIEGEDELERFF